MRLLICAALCAGLMVAAGDATAATLAFRIDVLDSTDPGFTPFSFFQTWSLSPDGSATASDTPFLSKMKAIDPHATTFSATWGEDLVGPTRGFISDLQLNEESSAGAPFRFSLRLENDHLNGGLKVPVTDPGFAAYAGSAGHYTFELTGPVRGAGVGPTREFIPEEITYRGLANLVAVPEPAAWALMLGGFGLLGAALRRWRTVAA